MAYVTIYEEHREILESLISSGRVASAAGATKTGPFKEQREAYVFAASIAMAINKPTPADKMPTSKKGHIQIRDSVFLGAGGAAELSLAVALIIETDHSTIEQSLVHQLDLISEQQLGGRLALLDRFAHAGFSWLAKRRGDESSIRDLILTAIDEIVCVTSETTATEALRDPMLDMLL
jgi:hypothetical protein